ncbi:MAG: 50S ribosomal protein L4 [Clostridia bacterium]|nr:50S ribosomal protein L4 [Clostridia bacterium]
MPSVKVYKQTGVEAGSIELDDSVFAAEYNEALIHQVVVAQRNNARQGTKCTLTRTEVRGGGIKPWRQKGTGRARQGSIRAPQWAGGGVVFAPKPRDFSQKVNKQARRAAICSALSEKLRADELKVVEEIKIEPKTKQMAKVLGDLKLDKRVLIVVTEADGAVVRAAGNIPGVSTLACNQINVYDLVANGKCVMTVDAVKKIEEAYKA